MINVFYRIIAFFKKNSAEIQLANFHNFINYNVFKKCSSFKFPQIVFPSENEITRHLINKSVPFPQCVTLRRLDREQGIPEVYTGTDIMLLYRGNDSNGHKKEFRVCYQAKRLEHRADNNHKIKLDTTRGWRRLSVNQRQYLREFINEGVLPNVALNLPLWHYGFQHYALNLFSRGIGACPLYLIYRYKKGFVEDKSKAVSFLFSSIISLKFLHERINNRRYRFTYDERELEGITFYAKDVVPQEILGDGGFFHLSGNNTNIEKVFENYKNEIKKAEESLTSEESARYNDNVKIDASDLPPNFASRNNGDKIAKYGGKSWETFVTVKSKSLQS